MRLFVSIVVLVAIALSCKSQVNIPINTIFNLELIRTDSTHFICKLLSKEPFNGQLNSGSARLSLSDSLANYQVQGIFATGHFGGSSGTQLVIKTGYHAPLNYRASINLNGSGSFTRTSTVPVYSQFPSIETWPYRIGVIRISDFSKVETMPVQEVEKLDTVCRSNFDVAKGNALLKDHFKFVMGLISGEKSDIEKLKEYEQSIQSASEIFLWLVE